MEQIEDGIWRWAVRHPEWHPSTAFGAEVASYALTGPAGTLLFDPLLPEEPGDVLEALDGIVHGRLRILITIPYHTRSAETLWRRYGGSIEGHPAVQKRLHDPTGFVPVTGGEPMDGGIVPVRIGNPRRYETPFVVPSHGTLVFGDSVVEADGELRVWIQQPITPERERWYRTRLRPSLEPLLDHECERVLVTHGRPVLAGGREALRSALGAGPWYHRPS